MSFRNWRQTVGRRCASTPGPAGREEVRKTRRAGLRGRRLRQDPSRSRERGSPQDPLRGSGSRLLHHRPRLSEHDRQPSPRTTARAGPSTDRRWARPRWSTGGRCLRDGWRRRSATGSAPATHGSTRRGTSTRRLRAGETRLLRVEGVNMDHVTDPALVRPRRLNGRSRWPAGVGHARWRGRDKTNLSSGLPRAGAVSHGIGGVLPSLGISLSSIPGSPSGRSRTKIGPESRDLASVSAAAGSPGTRWPLLPVTD